MLTENFFIYCEDVDWSKRIQNARGIGLYVSNACMWHRVSQSFSNDINNQLKRIYLFSRSRFIVQRNYHVSKIMTTEAGIYHHPLQDFYLIINEQENDELLIKIYQNPLVSLIWIGVFVMCCSGFLGLSKK